ncbi:MAG: 50S ribosomal protein L11 methyltransferase [Rhodospirillales bacterium]|nr:50S ribosomal protein L11 methyltransferase [Rhodospirillales bacterium]
MYRIWMRVPADARITVEEMLLGITEASRTVIEGSEAEISGYSRQPPDTRAFEQALAGVGIRTRTSMLEPVPDDDWVTRGLARQPPVRAGQFVLRGRHSPACSAARNDICVDAGPAFGTGHHPTTATMIEMLVHLAHRGFRPQLALDMGTGAGTLAIVMARLWRCPVLAADNDQAAVLCARENVVRNRVARWVDVVEADGYDAISSVFDVVAANLFADPIRAMAPALARSLSTRGYAALSGLLVRQRLPVLRAHVGQGLTVRRTVRRDDWLTFLLARPRAAR